jgi:TPR repeat protein
MKRAFIVPCLTLAALLFLTSEAPRPEPTDAEEQYRLSLKYITGEGVPRDIAESAKWLRKAAEQGHAEAQLSLGMASLIGLSAPKDDAEGIKWLRKAAEQGNAEAQFQMANCDASGFGVPNDAAEAIKWYQKAAEQGHAGAQFELASWYAAGVGVPQDLVAAYMWSNLAEAAGNAKALLLRGQVSRRMTEADITEAQRRSRAWQAAKAVAKLATPPPDQTDAAVQCRLGEKYAKGDGVPKDEAEAVKWYRKAADQGYGEAMFWVGQSYEIGKVLPTDKVAAYMWYDLADESGYHDAKEHRELVAKGMSKDQILEARKRIKEWLAAHPP